MPAKIWLSVTASVDALEIETPTSHRRRRNAACKIHEHQRPPQIGSMLKCFSIGRKMGTEEMISRHSSGQPSTKMIA